jgi:hypothetical protein
VSSYSFGRLSTIVLRLDFSAAWELAPSGLQNYLQDDSVQKEFGVLYELLLWRTKADSSFDKSFEASEVSFRRYVH